MNIVAVGGGYAQQPALLALCPEEGPGTVQLVDKLPPLVLYDADGCGRDEMKY
jgi:hypothetical protein